MLRGRRLLIQVEQTAENIVSEWSGDVLDLTPEFSISSLVWAVNDVIELRRSTLSSLNSYTAATANISNVAPFTLSSSFDFSGNWTITTWYTQFWLKRNGSYVGKSNIETLALTTTTAVLTLPVDTVATKSSGIGSITTDIGNGTLYFVITTSATPPSAAQVRAGQNHLGAAASFSGSQAVTTSGLQTITGGFTGLTASTTYYAHYMHENVLGVQSSVSSGDGFTTYSLTPSLSSPVDTLTGSTTASGTVTTTGDDGTLYAVLTTSATPPSAAQVRAGQNHLGAAASVVKSQAVSGVGVQTITGGFTGLSASTAYYAHYMHESAGALQSTVASANGFTTDAATNPSVAVGHLARDANSLTTSTHSIDFGTINFQKTAAIVVNMFSTGAGNIMTGLTVDDVSATEVIQHNQGFSHTAIFRIAVTTGGTKSIVVTSSAIMRNIDVAVHILTDMNPVPVGTDKYQHTNGTTRTLFNGSSGNGSGVQVIPSGGVAILACASQYNHSTTFPPATTDYDTFTGASGTIQSTTGHHYGSDVDPVTTVATNSEFSTIGAIWGP